MNKMKELKFMVDLDWKIRFKGVNITLAPTAYFKEFMEFLETRTGQRWLTTEYGLLYKKWQEE